MITILLLITKTGIPPNPSYSLTERDSETPEEQKLRRNGEYMCRAAMTAKQRRLEKNLSEAVKMVISKILYHKKFGYLMTLLLAK